MAPGYRSRLEIDYKERIAPELIKQFSYKNVMQAPRLRKIVLNMGIGEGSRDAKMLDALRDNLAAIAGQQPVVTKAKKSIANFKIREGMPVGCMVTLRRTRMYDFLDRFINICVPRIRDFRGLPPRSFDGRGNYALGVQEQLIFPEINYDSVPAVQGLDIIFVTSAPTDEEAMALLKLFGMPFRN
ncbi:MAG: 50S ribosomal protein L5 [Candidatus Hinthialibacter sp.]